MKFLVKKSRFAMLCLFALCILGSFLVYKTRTSEAANPIYYFNNAVNTDPSTLGNYWEDEDLTIQASSIPDDSIDRITVVAGAIYEGNISFRGGGINHGTVTGDARFYTKSYNDQDGIVQGNANFESADDGDPDFSYNAGSIQGTAEFYNNASNASTGEILGAASFNNLAVNEGEVDGEAVFNGTSHNAGTINADAIFNEGSFNDNAGTIDGDAEFNGNSVNSGLVTGEAIFYGNTADNQGTVNGLKTRYYQSFAVAGWDFIADGPWKVVADGAIVKIGTATYDNTTSFVALNKGFFSDTVAGSPETLDATHVEPVGASGATYVVVLNGRAYAVGHDTVTTYNILTEEVEAVTTVPAGTDLYTGRYGAKLYIPNGATTVSIFDTTSNSVIGTVSVGNGAKTVTTAGTKLYVTSQFDDTVSVIDGLTDDLITTINVGDRPFYASTLGNKVYVSNDSGGTLSVIDAATDTVEETIGLGGGEPVLITAVGTKLYVSNKGNNYVSIIDSTTNSNLGSIPTGECPEMGVLIGLKLYVNNRCSNDVTVIDTSTDSVIRQLPVDVGPYYLTASGTNVYVGNEAASTVSVIDSLTDTVTHSVNVGSGPFYVASDADHVYAPTQYDTFPFSVISIPEINLPHLSSFTSSTASGTYTAAQNINITANFNRQLLAESTMTVQLNTGASVVLSTVSGSTLSGTYTVSTGDRTPDLAVTGIISASVTDTSSHHRTAYYMPFSAGNFTGENSLIKRDIGDSKNIVIGSYKTISVGDNPYQVSAPVTVSGVQYMYVANQGSTTVSVVRISDNVVTATIPVGSEPYGLAPLTIGGTTYMYVANTDSNTVSVINTDTNTVTATIPVGLKPYYVAVIGTKAYVTNGQSNTVSVINGLNNTVTATIPVGAYPRGIKAFGTDLYVANYGDPYYYVGGNSVSVINSLTNQVTNTIIMPAGSLGARGVAVSSNRVYVTNYNSHNVSVINPATKAVVATIAVGNGPRGLALAGSNLYVENFDDGTISVINTADNTVTATVNVGHSPAGMGVSGTDIYFSRFQDNVVSILDTTTNSLRTAAARETTGGGGGVVSPATNSGAATPEPTPEPAPIPELDPCLGSGILDQIRCEASVIFADAKGAIERFIAFGTRLTFKLGSGERAGVIKSFKTAFGREPVSAEDWSDIIKLSSGRWPTQRNTAAEARAASSFKSVYGREPDMANNHDNAAIMMMAYGLRPVPRQIKHEIIAFRTYVAIFKRPPLTTAAWDMVRAIGYSGARQ